MKHSLFKSLRAELIFYVAVSMFLSVITEFACGVGLYILSTALGISYRGYGRSDMKIVGRKAGEHIPKTNFFTYQATQTLNPDLLNEILAQTSEVGEYQIYVKNDDELLISGPVPTQTANEDVNYPTLESSLNSASIYLGQKNRYKLANEEDAQSGLALVEE